MFTCIFDESFLCPFGYFVVLDHLSSCQTNTLVFFCLDEGTAPPPPPIVLCAHMGGGGGTAWATNGIFRDDNSASKAMEGVLV